MDKYIKGDIIYYHDRYFKFLEFKTCNWNDIFECEECSGDLVTYEFQNNKKHILMGCNNYTKVVLEEFITEEEFSI